MFTAPMQPREARGSRQRDVTRRLRDVLRSNVNRGAYADQRLPSETDLMRDHGASRAVVREALALLCDEGLVERVQGLGTHAVQHAVVTRLTDTHGVAPQGRGIWSGVQRPRILDWSVVQTPDVVTARLGPHAGPECLRIEYVAQLAGEPIGVATNYVRFPEADAFRDVPFESDFYALVDAAGMTVGASEFLIGCVNADDATADLLDVKPGAAIMTLEQIVFDESGRPFDLALCVMRADRFQLLSRGERPGFRALGGSSAAASL